MSEFELSEPLENLDIAIIGMAGRFPGANNIDEYWEALRNGVEAISYFTDAEMEAAGVEAAQYQDAHYVNAGGVLPDIDLFDASFFGFYPREADIIDPQQRVFLETAWTALENAAYDPDKYDGLIGIYGGSSLSTYLIFNLMTNSVIRQTVHGYQLTIANDKDFLPTRVSYKLNLRGPSVNIQTACSTSLVATHMACQSLLDYQCDMALAGGVAIRLPQKSGYLYQEGGIASPDGHCRPFSFDAQGTVGGDGVGIVVLKRLNDAIADGDHIYAVIKGTAINNDGSLKVGYTAPSVKGQAEVITTAQALASVHPESISYIEAHGTGTSLGDPIEIEALTQVFRQHTEKKQFCAIGSVKANIGHLDAAAGVAGLIKTAMALYKEELPPSINFLRPNPQIDLANSPFYVQTELSAWESDRESRRAAVSSFGMGGTNSHAVLEQAPASIPSSPSRPWQLVLLSARTPSALNQATSNLENYVEDHPDDNLADIAFTYHIGRKDFKYRQAAVVQDINDLSAVLKAGQSDRLIDFATDYAQRPVVFMFSGQGAQYPNMARGLYAHEPVFQNYVDICCGLLEPELGLDLRSLLFPARGEHESAAEQLRQTRFTQPALFTIEYALSQLWMQWGIQPESMIGHSIGEYVAACLAGVFSLEDALSLVSARGRLMQSLPGGSMLSVQLSETELQPYLNADSRLSLATINGAALCVISGPHEAVDALEEELDRQGEGHRRLNTSHAFHSQMMEPILDPFAELVAKIGPRPPVIPFVSNVTGTWIREQEAIDPTYWSRHIRQAVRFADGVAELAQEPARVLLEVGPSNTLMRLAQWHPAFQQEAVALSSLRQPKQHRSDVSYLQETLGRLWLSGVSVDWSGYYQDERRQRLPLPTYPFERQRHWIEAHERSSILPRIVDDSSKRKEIAEWFYLPTWKRAPLGTSRQHEGNSDRKWLVFSQDGGVSQTIAEVLAEKLDSLVRVKIGEEYAQIDDVTFTLDPDQPSDFDALMSALHTQGKMPTDIVHTPCLDSDNSVQMADLYGLLHLMRSLGASGSSKPINVAILSTNVLDVTGEESLVPEKAAVLGFCRVVSQESPNITCRIIDVSAPQPDPLQAKRLFDNIIFELTSPLVDITVAYRGSHRWVQAFDRIQLDDEFNERTRIRSNGVYFITGGLGQLGMITAEYLAREAHARLVLVGRTPLPEPDQWTRWLDEHDEMDDVSEKIRRIRLLEGLGVEVLVVSADVADVAQMEQALASTFKQFGELHGVIHSAGLVGESAMQPIDGTSLDLLARHFRPKADGLRVLGTLLQHFELDFVLVQSSLSTVLGGLGMASYAAANSYADAFAAKQSRQNHAQWLSVNWDGWRFSDNGRAVDAPVGVALAETAITPEEGTEALDRIFALDGISRIVVSTTDLEARFDRWVRPRPLDRLTEKEDAAPAASLHVRPVMGVEYIAPRSDLERSIVELWQEVLGIGPIGVDDDFFALGGHSLLATQIVSRLRDMHGVSLPLRALFESSTTAGLALLIEQERTEKTDDDLSYPTPVARDGSLPLSSGQERLWFLDLLEPGSPLYNNFAAIRISGPIDLDVFTLSLNEMIKRHEILRTSFAERDGMAMSIIHTDLNIPLRLIDLRTETSAQLEERVQTLALEEARLPFDLSAIPLLRATMLQLDEGVHVLFLTMHHIISDGWSMSVLIQELTAVYEAFIEGQASPLPPLNIQYVDYASWQRRLLTQGAFDNQVAYWKSHLVDVPALALPTTFARPRIQTSNGANLWFQMSEEMHQELVTFGQEQGVTLFMTLLAGIATLLHRYTLQNDFAIGSPIANRTTVETEGLIGFLLNTLVLRMDLSGDPPFVEFLESVKQAALNGYAHQDLPFDVLVETLQPERDMSRTPLFQVMFDLQKVQQIASEAGDLDFASLKIDDGTAKFDIAFSLEEGERSLGGYLNYNADLFDHSIPSLMIEQFQALLRSIIVDPNKRLSELSLSIASEAEASGTWLHSGGDVTTSKQFVHHRFEVQAERVPDVVALVWEGEDMTYGELNRRANKVAHRLLELGVGPEHVVGLYFERSVEMIVGMLAVLKAGGAFASLDLNYPVERLTYMISDASIGIVLTHGGLASAFDEHQVLTVVIDDDTNEIVHQKTDNPDLPSVPEQLAYLIYTSGTTGTPKGVMISHDAIAQHCQSISQHFGLTPDDRMLQFAALTFDQGLEQVFAILTSGATLFMRGVDIWQPADFGKIVVDNALSVINLPPAYWNQVVRAWSQWQDPPSAESLRLIIIGGDVLTPESLQYWQKTPMWQARLLNAYGPTEGTITASTHEVDSQTVREDNALPAQIPIGQPVPPRITQIIDKNGNLAPVNTPGELYLGGVLARGYLGRPAATAQVFVPDPFSSEPGARLYKTGDLVRQNPEGDIEFVGRVDHQVKVRGFRIELGEIEALLLEHAAVMDAVVITRTSEQDGGSMSDDKQLVAYVVADPSQPPSAGDLYHHCKSFLPPYMVPSAYIFLDTLPIIASGKINWHALPAPEPGRPSLAGIYTAPRTSLEEDLAKMWSQVLDVERVGIYDNFFELGGHSLLATQLVFRVQESYPVDLPLRRLFEAPTIAELTVIIEENLLAQQSDDELAQLLADLESMTDDEAAALLSDLDEQED